MQLRVGVKICGITTEDAIAAAVAGGASFVGLVFYPPSPRNVTLDQAVALAAAVPPGVTVTALTVDADQALIDEIARRLRPGLWQLHGAETPARARALRRETGIAVMKAIRVGSAADLDAVADYEAAVDRLLFDAKPPAAMAGALPGGNALSFDWSVLAGRRFARPWMLSGGLDADNVAEAVRISGAPAVDVSSGVESRPGVKDPARIAAFLAALMVC